jgi:hypothetical protein
MKNYKREEVISKLAKRGIKIINGIAHIPESAEVGIKLWGMINFLKVNWIKTKR